MNNIFISIILAITILTGCSQQQILQLKSNNQIQISPAIVQTTPIQDTKANNNTIQLSTQIQEYLQDVETQTHRKITTEQKKLLAEYLSNNKIEKLDKNTTAQRRKEFDKARKKLILQWEQHIGNKWPKYENDVLNDKGNVIRTSGSNYDAHHIVELSYGGVAEWWNLTPAKFPDEHQEGIHRKNSPGNRLFSENN